VFIYLPIFQYHHGLYASGSGTEGSSTATAALAAAYAYGSSSGFPSSAASAASGQHFSSGASSKLDYNGYYNYMAFYGNSGYGSGTYGPTAAAAANGLHQPLYQLNNLPPPASITEGTNVIDPETLKAPGRNIQSIS
jgi:hypothetical protein